MTEDGRERLRDRTAEILNGPDSVEKDLCLEQIYSSPYFGERLAATVQDPKDWEKLAEEDTKVFKEQFAHIEAHLLAGLSRYTNR